MSAGYLEYDPANRRFTLPPEHTPALAQEASPVFFGGIYQFDSAARRPPEFGRGIDEELILTRYPVLASEVLPLYSPLAPFFFRHVLYARIDHL